MIQFVEEPVHVRSEKKIYISFIVLDVVDKNVMFSLLFSVVGELIGRAIFFLFIGFVKKVKKNYIDLPIIKTTSEKKSKICNYYI